MQIPSELWPQLQRVETMLIHAGRRRRPEQVGHLMDGCPANGADRVYLTRFFSGFDPANIRSIDYLVRYPFSSLEEIGAVLERLREAGLVTSSGDAYAMTSHGLDVAKTWLGRVGELLDGLGGDAVGKSDVQRLIGFDHRILEAMERPSETFATPIFDCRRLGVQPGYDPPRLWHHWQLAWSMVACHEDAEQAVRKSRGIDSLQWFVRRQLWFVPRRPWRVRIVGSTLHAVAQRYAPVSEDACRDAWSALVRQGHAAGTYEAPEITDVGLVAHEADEDEIDRLFLDRWPSFRESEITELTALIAKLNGHLNRLATVRKSG